jgi:hypothetical protein
MSSLDSGIFDVSGWEKPTPSPGTLHHRYCFRNSIHEHLHQSHTFHPPNFIQASPQFTPLDTLPLFFQAIPSLTSTILQILKPDLSPRPTCPHHLTSTNKIAPRHVIHLDITCSLVCMDFSKIDEINLPSDAARIDEMKVIDFSELRRWCSATGCLGSIMLWGWLNIYSDDMRVSWLRNPVINSFKTIIFREYF